jgi:hypothetical protein
MENLSQDMQPQGQYFNLGLPNKRQEGYHSIKRSIYIVSININEPAAPGNVCGTPCHSAILRTKCNKNILKFVCNIVTQRLNNKA